MTRRPPRSTPFPYTPLSRSGRGGPRRRQHRLKGPPPWWAPPPRSRRRARGPVGAHAALGVLSVRPHSFRFRIRHRGGPDPARGGRATAHARRGGRLLAGPHRGALPGRRDHRRDDRSRRRRGRRVGAVAGRRRPTVPFAAHDLVRSAIPRWRWMLDRAAILLLLPT